MHFNTRYLQTETRVVWWRNGYYTLPYHLKMKKIIIIHLEKMCNKFNKSYYKEYKKWCDDYFYLPHRKEARGIGGIFFDYLHSDDWGNDFDFVQAVGNFFHYYSTKTIKKLKEKSWNEQEKNIQLLKRSRYAEFNLLHDRGTRFGLETGGNIDAILMSMPPLAKWD